MLSNRARRRDPGDISFEAGPARKPQPAAAATARQACDAPIPASGSIVQKVAVLYRHHGGGLVHKQPGAKARAAAARSTHLLRRCRPVPCAFSITRFFSDTVTLSTKKTRYWLPPSSSTAPSSPPSMVRFRLPDDSKIAGSGLPARWCRAKRWYSPGSQQCWCRPPPWPPATRSAGRRSCLPQPVAGHGLFGIRVVKPRHGEGGRGRGRNRTRRKRRGQKQGEKGARKPRRFADRLALHVRSPGTSGNERAASPLVGVPVGRIESGRDERLELESFKSCGGGPRGWRFRKRQRAGPAPELKLLCSAGLCARPSRCQSRVGSATRPPGSTNSGSA